jgi:hypothetical protein
LPAPFETLTAGATSQVFPGILILNEISLFYNCRAILILMENLLNSDGTFCNDKYQ